MTDEEYREWLVALARKHLEFPRDEKSRDLERISRQVERLTSIAQLAQAVKNRSNDSRLVNQLANELKQAGVDAIVKRMEDTGVLAALDELPEVTFGELRRSAIPEEDVDLLFRSGVNNPEEEIKLVIQYARYRISRFHAHEPYPSKYASDAQPNLNRAADRVEKIDDVPPAKKRKLFNGIGRLLGGAITAG